ncbi:hypothetical protein WMY93_032650 [Mugilogobius chulae]|uniref:Uncharacterized protein n=1 Tax=Mugilogobius chulae TaxID=88201 RepID=A0AAW0MK94_9GOBI
MSFKIPKKRLRSRSQCRCLMSPRLCEMSFKIPKKASSDSVSVQMTSPLSKLQGPDDRTKGFSSLGDRSGISSNSKTPLIHIKLKSRPRPGPGPKPDQTFSTGESRSRSRL